MTPATKQFHRLLRTIESFSNGQARIPEDSYDLDELSRFHVELSPSDGHYRGGTYDFEIAFYPHWFPDSPPRVRCLSTPIYHPNIRSRGGDVCLNLLDQEWSSALTFEDIIQGLLFLMYNPEINDPLSEFFSGKESEVDFRRTIRETLRGGQFFNTLFHRNLDPAFDNDELSKKEEVAEGSEILHVACAPEEASCLAAVNRSASSTSTTTDAVGKLNGEVTSLALLLVQDELVEKSTEGRPSEFPAPGDKPTKKHQSPIKALKGLRRVRRNVARFVRAAVEK